MSKKAWYGVAAVVSVLIAAILVVSLRPATPMTVRIGAILPLTGDAAAYGASLKRGMDLALSQVNEKNGIDGKKLHIVYEDDGNKPQAGVTAFRKLASADRVPMVIGAMFSAVTLAIAPIAESDHIVLLSPTSSAIELTEAGDYVFRIYPSDSYDGQFLATFAYQKLRSRKASILSLQSASHTSVAQLFKRVFVQNGGTIVYEDSFQEGATDFRSLLTKLKTHEQDVTFLPGSLKEMALILRQARELGMKSRFLSISTFYDPKMLQLAGNAAEGVFFSSPAFDPSSDRPEMQAFVRSYRAKYDAEPDILAAYGYDVVMIACRALRAGSHTPEQIKAHLYGIRDFPGLTGETSFDRNGDVVKELKMMHVKNGKFEAYDQ